MIRTPPRGTSWPSGVIHRSHDAHTRMSSSPGGPMANSENSPSSTALRSELEPQYTTVSHKRSARSYKRWRSPSDNEPGYMIASGGMSGAIESRHAAKRHPETMKKGRTGLQSPVDRASVVAGLGLRRNQVVPVSGRASGGAASCSPPFFVCFFVCALAVYCSEQPPRKTGSTKGVSACPSNRPRHVASDFS